MFSCLSLPVRTRSDTDHRQASLVDVGQEEDFAGFENYALALGAPAAKVR